MNIITMTNNTIEMTSREIAQLTGKEHKNVLADIRKMLKELDISSATFVAQFKSVDGRTLEQYILPKDEVICLVSGYNVKLRMAIIKRLNELESQSPVLPVTYSQALEQLLVTVKEKEQLVIENKQLEKTKSYISDKKTAQAMQTASVKTRENNKLKIELGISKEYATIKRVTIAIGEKYKFKSLKDYSLANGLDIIKVPDNNYGNVSSYHCDAWFECYGVDILELK